MEYWLLSGSPCLVWVVVAALLFSVLWDGAGSAGAALFQTECSTNLPLGLAVPSWSAVLCWGANHPQHPIVDSFSRT